MRWDIKKIILLVVLVVVCAGCASQRSANFEFKPTGELVVAGDKSQVLPDGDLVGAHCTVNMQDGTVLKGIILEISPLEVSIGKDKDSDALEEANAIVVAVGKNEIESLTLTQKKSSGFSTGDMTVVLVMIPAVLIFWFLTTLEIGLN